MTAEADISIDFSRSTRRTRELPLTPLIDVVFILIIFFMLTTNFMKIQSMELLLPSSAAAKNVTSSQLAHVYLYNDGRIGFGQRLVNADELNTTLQTMFERNPDQRIIMLAANKVSLQSLVNMMDVVYQAGAKSIYVKAWAETLPPLPSVRVPIVEAK